MSKFCWQFNSLFKSERIFFNRLTIDKGIAKVRQHAFLRHSVYASYIRALYRVFSRVLPLVFFCYEHWSLPVVGLLSSLHNCNYLCRDLLWFAARSHILERVAPHPDLHLPSKISMPGTTQRYWSSAFIVRSPCSVALIQQHKCPWDRGFKSRGPGHKSANQSVQLPGKMNR